MSKTALVTGSSSGIGRAIAIRLAQDGFTLIVHYNKNQAGAENTLAEIKKVSPQLNHQIISFDQSNLKQVEDEMSKVNHVDVLVNNAGLHKDAPALLMDNASFTHVVESNLFGPFLLTKLCGKKMLLKKQGCIINMASLAGQTGNPGQANYAASKAALIALTKTLSMELGLRGIRVNAVAPGLIETEMIGSIKNIENLQSRIPLGRLGKAEEVADLVSFLCSEKATYITGQTIGINGGLFPN